MGPGTGTGNSLTGPGTIMLAGQFHGTMRGTTGLGGNMTGSGTGVIGFGMGFNGFGGLLHSLQLLHLLYRFPKPSSKHAQIKQSP